ncbi:unnamed protein product [Linum trigynum]|uniref:Uncharacterized protein n=1 Tax=Linum trigynum TaxID=586398 RepID=A0AAV2FPF2_9ROSI
MEEEALEGGLGTKTAKRLLLQYESPLSKPAQTNGPTIFSLGSQRVQPAHHLPTSHSKTMTNASHPHANSPSFAWAASMRPDTANISSPTAKPTPSASKHILRHTKELKLLRGL